MQYDRTKYLTYISNSKEWRIKRNQVIALKGRKCERCSSKKKIHIHHGTYERLYNEEMSDLFVLCGKCHDLYHTLNKKISVETTEQFIGVIQTQPIIKTISKYTPIYELPKFPKSKKKNKKQQKRKLTKLEKQNAANVYREVQRQRHEELKKIWRLTREVPSY